MSKKAVVVISLVDESVEKLNKEIEKEIFGSFQKIRLRFLGSKVRKS